MTGKLLICNSGGHTEVEWDAASTNTIPTKGPLSQEAVDKEFTRLVQGGHLAYVNRGHGNEQIRHFDPTAQEIILTPALAGG